MSKQKDKFQASWEWASDGARLEDTIGAHQESFLAGYDRAVEDIVNIIDKRIAKGDEPEKESPPSTWLGALMELAGMLIAFLMPSALVYAIFILFQN